MEYDKKLIVHGKKFPVNSTWLSFCSPVFAAMFQTDMIERSAIDIPIGDITSVIYFEDFLYMISPEMISPERQILPNRKHFVICL